MASFKKRDNGSYQARIYVGRDEKGKIIYEFVTKPTLKECKAAAREIEQEIEEGKFIKIKNIRVIALIKKHIENNSNVYAPTTKVLYKGYIKNHYEPFFKGMKVKEVNELHAKAFKNYLLGKMSATSARRALSFIKTVFSEALKNKSPFNAVKLPKANDVQYHVPEDEQFQEIYNTVIGTDDEPKVLLGGWMGFRREEIWALKPDDLDFNNNKIRIDEAYVINEECKYEFKEPKSDRGKRWAVAPKYLMDLLKPIADERMRELMSLDLTKFTKEEIEEKKRLFQGRPDNYSSYFPKMLREKGLPHIRFYDLRHYQATWLHDNGFPDDYAAKRLGHTKTVLREIYQHLGLNKEKKFDEKIAKLNEKSAHKKRYRAKLRRTI